ncbi:MAG: hypothetical protein Q4Q18_09415, partial [Methanobrevibacter sp.]|nr:hypothetical protein [Methanobrevibacter sp.]
VPDFSYFKKSKQKEIVFNELILDNYFNFLEVINSQGYENEIFMYVPEVVLCQLIFHHKNDLIKVLNGKKNIELKNIGIDDLKDINFHDYCKKLKTTSENCLNIIKIPLDREKVFNEIFKRTIDKQSPFNGDSDPGFKSTLIFLSILNFISTDDTIVIVSDKEKFMYNHRNEYEREFHDYFANLDYSPLLHIYTQQKFSEWLDEEFGIKLVL